jgi:hypothetical protein
MIILINKKKREEIICYVVVSFIVKIRKEIRMKDEKISNRIRKDK